MIVDNADDLPNLFIDHSDGRKKIVSYLPKDAPNLILYSTRSKTSARQLATRGGVISVGPFNTEDSKCLLSEKLREANLASTPGEGWSEFLEELEYLPLAIVQAASYMIQNGWTVLTCLQHYRADKSVQMLKHELRDSTREEQTFPDSHTDENTTNAVLPMFTTIFSNIESHDPYAAELLCLMVAYHSQRIPKELLQDTEGGKSNVEYAESMGTLMAFSLVSTRDDSKNYNIHRLVQLSVRDWLRRHDRLQPWILRGMAMISKCFPNQLSSDQDDAKSAELIPHFMKTFSQICFVECEKEKDAFCSLFTKFSVYFGYKEKLEMSMKCAQLASEFAKLYMTDDKLSEPHTNLVLAKALASRGEYDAAEEMCRTALGSYAVILGPHEVLTHDAMHLLGSILHARGRFKEAFFTHKEVVDLSKATFGLDQTYERGRFTSMALSYAAHSYNLNHWFDTSLQNDNLLEDVLTWTRVHKGMESRAARLAMTDLATSLLRGNLDRAWELNEEVLSLKGEPLDPSDPNTRENLRIRTLILYGRDKNTEAERWAWVVLNSSEQALGLKHPKTLEHVWTLALVLIAQRKWEETQSVAARAYEGYTELYGPEDPFTINSRILLEVALHNRFKYGYNWVREAAGLWRKKPYNPEEMKAQDFRVRVAEELPYEAQRHITRGVEWKPEDLEAWRNHSLMERLPRRQFPGYIRATLYEDPVREFMADLWERPEISQG